MKAITIAGVDHDDRICSQTWGTAGMVIQSADTTHAFLEVQHDAVVDDAILAQTMRRGEAKGMRESAIGDRKEDTQRRPRIPTSIFRKTMLKRR